MKVHILVSGATGQLGQSLQEIAPEYPEFEFSFCNREQLDLSSEDSIRSKLSEGFDYFINAGAYTQVDAAEENEALAFAINADALLAIAKNASANCRILHISSDYVYHIDKTEALNESDPCEPKSVYARSKLEGERNLLKTKPDSLVIRSSWIYSNYGHNFVKTMLRLADSRDSLNIVSDQIGTPTYAFDLAKALLDIIKHLDNLNGPDDLGGVYNYANENCTNWAEFAEHIFALSNKDCKVMKIPTSEYPTPAARPLWSCMSKDKIRKAFSVDIPDWHESLKACLDKLEQ